MIRATASGGVVLCRGGQPLQHLVALADCPLAFVSCDLPLHEQAAASSDTPAIIVDGRPRDLLEMPNILISPRSSGRSVQTQEKTGPHVIANIVCGERPISVVTPV